MIFMHYFLLPARICCCKFYNNLTGKGTYGNTPRDMHSTPTQLRTAYEERYKPALTGRTTETEISKPDSVAFS